MVDGMSNEAIVRLVIIAWMVAVLVSLGAFIKLAFS